MSIGAFLATWFAVSVLVGPVIGTMLHRAGLEVAVVGS
jgi:hypothetical protein